MADEVVKTIKESGGDYTSLNAWEAAAGGVPSGNCVANDAIAVAECYTRSSPDATSAWINGFTTDSTHWVEIRAAVGHEYSGVDGVGYVLRASATRALLNYCAHLRIYGITLDCGTQLNGYQTGTFAGFSGTPGVRLVRCRVIGDIKIDASATAYQTTVVNCVVNSFEHAANSNVSVLMLGCTQIGRYILRENNALTIKNCLLSATDAFLKYTGATVTALNCALKENSLSDINTNLGGCRQGQTFTFAGTGDWHLSESDAGARGYGTDIPSDYTTLDLSAVDIDGQTITTWSIGADAQAGAAPVVETPSGTFLRKLWRQKPPPSVQIDWSNPLSQGLCMAFALNEGGGAPRDIVGKGYAGSISMGDTSWNARGLVTSQYTACSMTSPVKFQGPQPSETFLFRGLIADYTNTGGSGFVCGNNSSNFCVDYYGASDTRPKYTWYDSGTKTTTVANAPSLTLRKPFTLVVSRTINTLRFFVDGVLVDTKTPVGGVSYPNNWSLLNNSVGWTKAGTEAHVIQWWNRDFSDSEVATISENPWQIFQPQRRVFYADMGAAPSGYTYSLSMSWASLIGGNRDSAWALLAESARQASWADQNDSSRSSSWADLNETPKTSSWADLNDSAKVSSWADQAQGQRQSEWGVMAIASPSSSWAILRGDSASSAWDILSASGLTSRGVSWAISTQQDTPSAWAVAAQNGQITSWRVVGQSTRDAEWSVVRLDNSDLSWAIQKQVAGDSSWMLLTTDELLTSWRIGEAPTVSTPLSRLLSIAAESRSAGIARESRLVAINNESRTIIIL